MFFSSIYLIEKENYMHVNSIKKEVNHLTTLFSTILELMSVTKKIVKLYFASQTLFHQYM